jgi:hypothetical protein
MKDEGRTMRNHPSTGKRFAVVRIGDSCAELSTLIRRPPTATPDHSSLSIRRLLFALSFANESVANRRRINRHGT